MTEAPDRDLLEGDSSAPAVPVPATSPPGPFRAAWWLPGPHLQSVWSAYCRGRRPLPYQRERLETPDGDELCLDHLPGDPRLARVLLLHGLEGSSYSNHVQGIARHVLARGHPVTCMNLRTCARDPLRTDRLVPFRLPRFYHAGDTQDLDQVIRHLVRRGGGRPLRAAAISLGGNILLKWLGENPGTALVSRAASLSSPVDLSAGCRNLESPIGRLYTRHYLRSLVPKVVEMARRYPRQLESVDLGAVQRAETFRQFDGAVIAPLFGFRDAEDYYARSSSLPLLCRIATPTLVLGAADDPFIPPEVPPRVREASSSTLRVEIVARGGHAGFVAGGAPWTARYWGEERVAAWLSAQGSDRG